MLKFFLVSLMTLVVVSCSEASEPVFGTPAFIRLGLEEGNLSRSSEFWVSGRLHHSDGYYLVGWDVDYVQLPVIGADSEQTDCLAKAAGENVRIVGFLGDDFEIVDVVSVFVIQSEEEAYQLCYFRE